MLTHVHKVVHLVIGTFDQGWRSWWSEGGDRHWETVTECWTCASGHLETWSDSEQRSDWTLVVHCSSSGHWHVVAFCHAVWSVWLIGLWPRQVATDRTCQVTEIPFGYLTGLHLMLGGRHDRRVWSIVVGMRGHVVIWRGASTTGLGIGAFGLTLNHAGSRTLKICGSGWMEGTHGLDPVTGRWLGCVRSCWPACPVSARQADCVCEPNGSISWGLLFKPYGWL
jgi:hypothetical protein